MVRMYRSQCWRPLLRRFPRQKSLVAVVLSGDLLLLGLAVLLDPVEEARLHTCPLRLNPSAFVQLTLRIRAVLGEADVAACQMTERAEVEHLRKFPILLVQ